MAGHASGNSGMGIETEVRGRMFAASAAATVKPTEAKNDQAIGDRRPGGDGNPVTHPAMDMVSPSWKKSPRADDTYPCRQTEEEA